MIEWQAESFGNPLEVLKQRSRPIPDPEENEAVVQVAACVVGLPDLMMLQGRYFLVPKPPVHPGQEVAGTVVKTGKQFPFPVGTRVMGVAKFSAGMGGLAEYTLLNASGTLLAPAELSNEEAAGFLGSFHVAYVGLVNRANLRPGETVLVLGGAGRTGSAAIQLSKALGAQVIATARDKVKADFCRAQGADFVIDPSKGTIDTLVNEITGGAGIDIIYDTVGGEPFRQATECIKLGGRAVLIGFASGSWGKPDPISLLRKGYAVSGALHSVRSASEREQAIQSFSDLLGRKAIKPPVTRIYGFDEASKAIDDVGKDMIGQFVVRLG